MSRSKDRGEGFRIAQGQQKRADRADERLAEVRRELVRAKAEASLAQALATANIDLMQQLGHLQAELDLERGLLRTCQQGWHLEALRRREDNARPLWRIAAQRLRVLLESTCR